ncbi:Acid stress-induced BolA-like protein IbaG/YrbA, predicted regulator of iron metabolism [Ectothiorhodospira magna]|uniref:Acid stress-induced BolA-like protein IbaG/YrbA, predicted regulator of iron metabolism n=1 Tax=Ectothiorhodospira magna TaxID=867345 RepID=A0A1H9AGD8_9GAMM|nr:BolA/IbaG family iron-sulfur metabolism protein [Ectothiorhodospira magna]SEP75760.1 Acid stress-induced BolA-like protein IbaG/YrbA, predicted regulator of iron metabolism [Ectothiorhodospira magna]
MTPEQVHALIANGLPDAQVTVSGQEGHFEALVICKSFAGLSRLKREQKVNATVKEAITSGTLHALSIRPMTPEEWAQKHPDT